MIGDLARRAGNKLYQFAFPLYREIYSAFKARSDRAERRLLVRTIAEGSVVVDAGANIGVYSRFLSRCVGPSGMVHSFEPSLDNFARLQSVVEDLFNVRPNQLAVSDKTGEQLLYVSKHLNVDHRTYPSVGEPRASVRIPATTLDDYFQPRARVDLIKLDIQGFELHALRGAERVLSDNPNIKLLFEFWPYGLCSAGGSPEELLSFLECHGLRVFNCDETGTSPYSRPSVFELSGAHFLNLFACR